MQSTGHSSTQARSLMSTQGCVMMYVTSNLLDLARTPITLPRHDDRRMVVTMDALGRLRPPLATGERVTLRLADPTTDLIGFVVSVEPLRVEDRHGRVHELAGRPVLAAR